MQYYCNIALSVIMLLKGGNFVYMPIEKNDELSEGEVNQLRMTLREYIDLRFSNVEKEFKTYQCSMDANLKNAYGSMEKRLEGMNEFRQTITDQANKYFTKAEHEAWKEKIEQELQTLRDFKLTIDTKASTSAVRTAYVVSGISIFLSFIGLILTILKLNIF
jgi:hypothetical protein